MCNTITSPMLLCVWIIGNKLNYITIHNYVKVKSVYVNSRDYLDPQVYH